MLIIFFQSISSRFLTTFWWMFCIVILFLYFINLKAYLFHDSTSLDSENQMTAQLNSVGEESNAIQDKRLEAFLNDKNTRLGYVHDGAIEYTLQVSKHKNAFSFAVFYTLSNVLNGKLVSYFFSNNRPHKTPFIKECGKRFKMVKTQIHDLITSKA